MPFRASEQRQEEGEGGRKRELLLGKTVPSDEQENTRLAGQCVHELLALQCVAEKEHWCVIRLPSFPCVCSQVTREKEEIQVASFLSVAAACQSSLTAPLSSFSCHPSWLVRRNCNNSFFAARKRRYYNCSCGREDRSERAGERNHSLSPFRPFDVTMVTNREEREESCTTRGCSVALW